MGKSSSRGNRGGTPPHDSTENHPHRGAYLGAEARVRCACRVLGGVMASKAKTTAKGKSTGRKPPRLKAKPQPRAPAPAGDKPPAGVPAPVGARAPSPAVPPRDKAPTPPAPPVPTSPGDTPTQSKAPQEQRFRVGRPSNPYLVLHPPPRLGRRR